MSHNFTQPEEIDQILMAMSISDSEADMPNSDGAKSVWNAWSIKWEDFSKKTQETSTI
jgi:hypothetical protein